MVSCECYCSLAARPPWVGLLFVIVVFPDRTHLLLSIFDLDLNYKVLLVIRSRCCSIHAKGNQRAKYEHPTSIL